MIDDPDLIDLLIGGDEAALRGRIERHEAVARTTRERQLVAIAEVRLAGDADLLDALIRDHLVDYPDGRLAAWLAR